MLLPCFLESCYFNFKHRSNIICGQIDAHLHPVRILTTYNVSQKIPPRGLVAIFPKQLGIFQPNFTCLLCVPIYARLQILIQFSATLTKLYHIERDHPVHIMCARCPPSAETYAGIFCHFPQTIRNF